MSIVNLKCSNHDLTLGSTPILASGSQNVDTISVEFDESWDAYGVKEAIFWKATAPNVAYRQVFENYASTAVIPANVLNEEGNIIFCLRGVNGDDIITTTIVTLDVVEGVATEGTDPSIKPSVYDEILKELQNIRLTCGEQIIEQNEKHAIEFWVGTQEQYDALETKPTDTLCIITDEHSISNTDALNSFALMFPSTTLAPTEAIEVLIEELTDYQVFYFTKDGSRIGAFQVTGGVQTDPEGMYVIPAGGDTSKVAVMLLPELETKKTKIGIWNYTDLEITVVVRPIEHVVVWGNRAGGAN